MKKNLPLLVGISLPIIFIIIISIVVYTPSLFIKPQYNFLYTNESSYYSYNDMYKNTYEVENNRVVTKPALPRYVNNNTVNTPDQRQDFPELYVYDTKADTSRKVTLDEARKYFVEPGPSSPDGYTVNYQYGHDGIFEIFGSNGDNRGYFISKGNGKKKLNAMFGDRYWNNGNFRLIGWIK